MNKDCPNRKQNSSNSKNVVQTNDSGSEAYMMCVSSSKWTNVCILDSSCSYYMASHYKWFTISRSDNFVFVYMSDDKAYTITRMRQIKIAMDDSGMRILNDGRYILKLRKKLISLSTLQENGFSYRNDGDGDII